MSKTYLMRPRGRGYAFRLAIPKKLRADKNKGVPGRVPGHENAKTIIKGLGTTDLKIAEREATKLLIDWQTVFARIESGEALSLGEIEDFATECYRASLARMANEAALQPDPDELIWLAGYLQIREEALERDDATPVQHEIEAAERRYGVEVPPTSATYAILVRALLRAHAAALKGRMKALQGEPSDKPATFLGADGINPKTLQPIKPQRTARIAKSDHGPWSLFEQWVTEAKPAASTVNRWRAVFLNLQDKFGERVIWDNDAGEWAQSLISDKRTALTVSETWLSAAKTIYRWASERTPPLIEYNPFAKTKVTVPDKIRLRHKAFTAKEAKTILKAASAIAPITTFQGAQHWVPWLCAYSGARSGEVCQLRKQDIDQQDGIRIMRISPDAGSTKTGSFREVPLHAEIIRLGFLKWVKARSEGPLFYNPRAEDEIADATNPKRPRAVKTRERLADWIRTLVPDKDVRPLHGFRHLFKTVAARAGIEAGIRDAICGHSPRTVADEYEAPTVERMAEALKKFPHYAI